MSEPEKPEYANNSLLDTDYHFRELTEDDAKFFAQVTSFFILQTLIIRTQLMDLLEPAEKRRHSAILEKTKDRVRDELKFLKEKNFG